MNTKPSPACCGLGVYWSPLYYVGTAMKVRFGVVRQCAKCHRLLGDAKLDRANGNAVLADVLKAFNGTSWLMAVEVNAKRPGAPLHFEKSKLGILMPEGYQGELKVQADLPQEPERDVPDEEVPF